MKGLVTKVAGCSVKMLKNYFKEFPNTRVMQSGYDVPCANAFCEATFTGVFDLAFCQKNTTCNNQGMYDFIDISIRDLTKQLSDSRYTTLFMMGAVQKANGVKGADVGKPVLTETANCAWETECVHPTYNTPAGKAWGDGFWDLYFSKHVSVNNASTRIVV